MFDFYDKGPGNTADPSMVWNADCVALADDGTLKWQDANCMGTAYVVCQTKSAVFGVKGNYVTRNVYFSKIVLSYRRRISSLFGYFRK